MQLQVRRVPMVAIGLTVAGGFFIFLGGLLFAAFGVALSLAGIHSALLFIGLLLGLLVWVMAGLMWAAPSGRVAWGAITIVIAFLSLIYAALGGFVIGFLLALAGGLAAIFSRGVPFPVVKV